MRTKQFLLFFPLLFGINLVNFGPNSYAPWPYVGFSVPLAQGSEHAKVPDLADVFLILGFTMAPNITEIDYSGLNGSNLTYEPSAVLGMGFPMSKSMYAALGAEISVFQTDPFLGVGMRL